MVKLLFLTPSSPPPGIATLSLSSPPANLLNTYLLRHLTSAIRQAEEDAEGIVLTSALPSIYSGGLDIQELYRPQPARLRQFRTSFQVNNLLWYRSLKEAKI